MHIIARCPQCGYGWRLDAAAADRRIRCRKCLRLFKIPDLSEVPAATEIISQTDAEIYVDDTGKTYG